ncbi:MAG: hypothetical protein M3P33_02820 [bacterium]|nr:hypothetical protein [bacterium]
MNNNLPEDLNNLPNQNKVDDTTVESTENSNIYAAPISSQQSYGESNTNSFEESDVALALSGLENLIRQKLSVIEKSQIELSEFKQQLSDILANSEEYYKIDKVYKEAAKQKKQVKSTIMGTQEAKTIQGKFDESKDLLKDNMGSLNDMLVEYYETMRIKEIDDLEGHQRDLIVSVKVAPPKKI